MIDKLDLTILKQLEKNGRATWSEIAEHTAMSSPGVIDRIKRLEEKGLIKGYSVDLNPDELGIKLVSFVFVKLLSSAKQIDFIKLIKKINEISECHHVTGSYDYLLKIFCTDTQHLENIISDKLKSTGLITETETIISLSRAKNRTNLTSVLKDNKN